MAGRPEDQTLQDRGQGKPEEHPQLGVAQSLPEGVRPTTATLHLQQCAHITISVVHGAVQTCGTPAVSHCV